MQNMFQFGVFFGLHSIRIRENTIQKNLEFGRKPLNNKTKTCNRGLAHHILERRNFFQNWASNISGLVLKLIRCYYILYFLMECVIYSHTLNHVTAMGLESTTP